MQPAGTFGSRQPRQPRQPRSTPPWHFGPALIGSFGLVGLASVLSAPSIGLLVDRLGPDRIVAAGLPSAPR